MVQLKIDYCKCLGLKDLKWWLGPESNRGHEDFQSSALPTELPSPEKTRDA